MSQTSRHQANVARIPYSVIDQSVRRSLSQKLYVETGVTTKNVTGWRTHRLQVVIPEA
jgi:hypothetical protein